MELLFRTIHGSRLYGLSHSGSDVDWFEVWGYTKFRSTQRISNNSDTTKVSLSRFLEGCSKGIPQYLEAAYSGKAEVDVISHLRAGIRPS